VVSVLYKERDQLFAVFAKFVQPSATPLVRGSARVLISFRFRECSVDAIFCDCRVGRNLEGKRGAL
jgi:hypothetical protein